MLEMDDFAILQTRLPRELLRRAHAKAAAEYLSVSAWLRRLIDDATKDIEAEEEPRQRAPARKGRRR